MYTLLLTFNFFLGFSSFNWTYNWNICSQKILIIVLLFHHVWNFWPVTTRNSFETKPEGKGRVGENPLNHWKLSMCLIESFSERADMPHRPAKCFVKGQTRGWHRWLYSYLYDDNISRYPHTEVKRYRLWWFILSQCKFGSFYF